MSGFVQGLFWMARGLAQDGSVSESSVKSVGARIADACNREGFAIRPLAKEYLADDTGLGPRQVQRALRHLTELDILRVEKGTGTGRGKPPVYEINLDRLSDFIPIDSLPNALRRRIANELGVELEKGDRLSPFSEEKGDNLSPFDDSKGRLSEHERETIPTEKGDSSVSHYIRTTESNDAGAGARAQERTPAPSREPARARKRTRRRRKKSDEEMPMPRPPKIAIPNGREGKLIEAALAGNDSKIAFKIKPWLGRFRMAEDLAGDKPVRVLVLDGDEGQFRSVFTGAMIHLDWPKDSMWSNAFMQRRVRKGLACWAPGGANEDWYKPAMRDRSEEQTHAAG